MKTSRILTARALACLACALMAAGAQAQLKAPRKGGPSLAAPAMTVPAAAAAKTAESAVADKAGDPTADAAARKENEGRLAALGWLMLLDRKDWGTAWESSSQVFRTQVPIATWMDAIPKVRGPLGALTGREPVEVAHKTALPGRPAGDYVTVVFASQFTNHPDLKEIVTTALDADGRWRVLGYSTQ